MARIKVRWAQVHTFENEFEIDGYDDVPADWIGDMEFMDAVDAALANLEEEPRCVSVEDTEYESIALVQSASEQVAERLANVKAPQRDLDDWGDDG